MLVVQPIHSGRHHVTSCNIPLSIADNRSITNIFDFYQIRPINIHDIYDNTFIIDNNTI